MAHDDPILRALCRDLTPWQQVELVASRQERTISAGQLVDCEVSPRAVRTAVGRRQLNRVHRGVYAVGIRRLEPRGDLWAAFLAAGSDTAICHESGAALAGFRRHARGHVHVAAPKHRRDRRRVTVHQVDGLCEHWIRRDRGLPVLKSAHLLLDIAPDIPGPALDVALSQALAMRLVTLDSVVAAIDVRAGHDGRGPLAAAVGRAADDPGAGRTHSELEDLVLLLLRDLPGLPTFLRNELVELSAGRFAKADLLFPRCRVMVELDSRRWHEQRAAMDSDRRRDQQALAVGVVTFRVTWRHATQEWDAVSGDLLALLDRRRRPVAHEVVA